MAWCPTYKGLNLPGVQVSVPLTSKDEADLRWALRLRADMIALSFVQGPADAAPARKIMDEAGVRLPLIAKIEKPQALDTLDEIVDAFDGIMVARGDLGVELPLEQVPMAEADHHRARDRGAKAGVDRGHPDAGVDDLRAAAGPRRGVRRNPAQLLVGTGRAHAVR